MSVVADQVRRLDAQLDRIPFTHLHVAADLNTPRIKDLLRITKALSASAAARTVAQNRQIQSFITQSKLLSERSEAGSQVTQYESDLEWLLVSKATVQTYGLIIDTLLDQIIPLSDHIWYWDDVLSSPTSRSLYMLQTSPMRFWAWSSEVYEDSKARLQRYTGGLTAAGESERPSATFSQRWRRFYGIVQESIHERSLANVQRRIMSPIALACAEARKKQASLKKLRDMTSSGLGVLIDEGLVFGGNGSDDGKSDIIMSNSQEWKGVVERSVALMDMVLKDVLALDVGVPDFEDRVFAGVDEDPELSIQVEEDDMNRPIVVARRLQFLLESQLPEHVKNTRDVVARNGRPSRLTRYWLPAVGLLLSSTTLLRIFVNRRQEILGWIQDFGATVRDFWFNWVVDPVKKIVGTIRHDSSSEIAIMSRDSLKADRDSLERMVVDFALDEPSAATGAPSLNETQIAEIRTKVRAGDVTPVLRAYERDLRRPFIGAIRGDLVRTLLIQVQKTKVDVEVAMAGIDALLKSQELVFGFLGLTPGVLVSFGAFRYLRGAFSGRRRSARKSGRVVRVLRNIDRIFSEATPSPNNLLSYKDHGLLVAEVHVLRRLAHKLLPPDVEKDFLEDVDDLANLKGIQSQQRALDRIRWAYGKWLLY
ncbi:ATP synthase regulation protein NCA2 [Xylariaceae sp. FL1272]|nr:ATP synthase regulation protein NCA2 [Xylariaceae sp. FL1272]